MLDIILWILLIIIIISSIFYSYVCIKLFWTKVPIIPTEKKVAQTMIELAKIKNNQHIFELGSGFGHVLFKTAQLHPENNFYGYELVRPAVWFCRIRNLLMKQDCQFVCQDFFKADLSSSDVIFCYLWPSIMEKIYLEIWPHLKPGTRLISHAFNIESLTPDEIINKGKRKIYLYIKN